MFGHPGQLRPVNIGLQTLIRQSLLWVPRCLPAITEIGSTTSVNHSASGKPPGVVSRILETKAVVHLDEVVVTDPNGWVHLQLNDDSKLKISSNSELVLDQFVFDDSQATGVLSINAG